MRSDIDGCIQMKTFMAGNPEIRIGLNEDFFIGKSNMLTQGILMVYSTIITRPGLQIFFFSVERTCVLLSHYIGQLFLLSVL